MPSESVNTAVDDDTDIEMQAPERGVYRISAVATLTGIPAPTIRMWERRYGAVDPGRSAGNGRLYSQADVDRLCLLRAAVDAGHAIGTIATLDERALKSRIEQTPRSAAIPARREPVVVCVRGGVLASVLAAAWADRADLRIHALDPVADPATDPDGADIHADVLIIEAPAVDADIVRDLRLLRSVVRAGRVVLIYQFAPRSLLARLDREGVLAVAGPAEPTQLARLCHLSAARPAPLDDVALPTRPARPRSFDDAALARLTRWPTSVQCECPNHLADLLTRLNAFEQYSLRCESRSPDDAAMHGMLHAATSHCRALMEQALVRVLAHEGIDPVG